MHVEELRRHVLEQHALVARMVRLGRQRERVAAAAHRLHVLRVRHARVADTAPLYDDPARPGRRFRLQELARAFLGREIQENEGKPRNPYFFSFSYFSFFWGVCPLLPGGAGYFQRTDLDANRRK